MLTADTDWAKCTKSCEPQSQWYLTVDQGMSFHPQAEAGEFCGPASIAMNDSSGNKVWRCIAESAAELKPDVAVFTTTDWKVVPGGLFSQAKLEGTKDTSKAEFFLGKFAKPESSPTSVLLGKNVVEVKEKKWFLRLATFTWGSFQKKSIVFKTENDGVSWTAINATSRSAGEQNLLMRTSEKGLLLYTSVGAGRLASQTGTGFGKKWGVPKPLNVSSGVPCVASSDFNTLHGGAYYGPPRIYVPGKKKGKEQILDLSWKHDSLVPPENQYGREYLEGSLNRSFDPKCTEAPFQGEGCSSTGAVEIVKLGKFAENSTVFIACYDKLASGWGGPAPQMNDEVWCQRVIANETAETGLHLKKLEREKQKKKQEEEAQIKAEKAREERKKRDQEKRRQKVRQEKERRKRWARMDYEQSLKPAFEQAELDGELVVVRDVDFEWEDIVSESVGLPGKDYEPPPEESKEEETVEEKKEESTGSKEESKTDNTEDNKEDSKEEKEDEA